LNQNISIFIISHFIYFKIFVEIAVGGSWGEFAIVGITNASEPAVCVGAGVGVEVFVVATVDIFCICQISSIYSIWKMCMLHRVLNVNDTIIICYHYFIVLINIAAVG